MPSEIITGELDDGFIAKGLKFREVRSNFRDHKTTSEEIVVLKGTKFLRTYDPVFASAPNKNVLEFGVFEGGSIIFFGLAYPAFMFVGVDIRQPSEAVLRHIHDLGLSDRVKIYYETSQHDQSAVERILRDDFGGDPLGVVMDDASHMYSLSRRTFELTFGRIQAGGTYVLEDWAWAHWGEPYQTQMWTDRPALSNLLFEIQMLQASVGGLIDVITVRSNVACIKRGPRSIGAISLDDLIVARGKKLALI